MPLTAAARGRNAERTNGVRMTRYAAEQFALPGYTTAQGTVHPCVVYFASAEDGYNYWMFYEYGPTLDPADQVINLVRSNDGVTWVETGVTNPVVDVAAGTHDPCVIKVGATWYLYAAAGNGASILSFVSSDGLTWTDQQTALSVGAGGTWDDTQTLSPTVYHDGTTFHMWYTGTPSATPDANVGYATSAAGRSFTKDGGNPIFSQPSPATWDSGNIWHIGVARGADGHYYMVYSAVDTQSGESMKLGMARSRNKTKWEKLGTTPIIRVYNTWEVPTIYTGQLLRDPVGNEVVLSGNRTIYYSGGFHPFGINRLSEPYAGPPAGNGLLNNLIAYWPMNEASGNALQSYKYVTADLTLTDTNTVTNNTGHVYATARQFTAANSEYFKIADNAQLSTGDIDLTVAMWIYLDSKPAGCYIFAKSSTSGPVAYEYAAYYLGGATDRFHFFIGDGAGNLRGTVVANSFGAPSTATWYLLVASHDSVANTVTLQVNNGTIDSVATTGALVDSTAAFFVGAIGTGASATSFYNGRIGPLMVWKSAAGAGGVLSAAKRTALYNSGNGLEYADFTG